jgi:hypothetical protein
MGIMWVYFLWYSAPTLPRQATNNDGLPDG